MARNSRYNRLWPMECIDPATRVWGIMCVIVMWGVGTDIIIHKHQLGAYVLFAAAVLTLLETTFVINIYLDICLKDDKHICVQCWQAILWLDLWKKSILYSIMAVFCFLKPVQVWLASVAGAMLVVLALLYLIMTYKVQLTMADASLYDKECSYDRFDDLQEEIDDSLPEPSSDNVGDQDRILQV